MFTLASFLYSALRAGLNLACVVRGHESIRHMRFLAVWRLPDYCCILTFRKIRLKSKFCRIRNWIYVCSDVYMSVRGSPVEIQSPAHWNLIGPTVSPFFFRQICLIAPPFQQIKIRCDFKKCCFFYFSVRFENFIWNGVIFNCLIRWMFILEKTMGIADKPKLFIGFWTYFKRSCESVHWVYLCSGLNQMTNVIELRLKKSNEMKQYTDIYLLLNYSTCFGRPSHPSSGVHKTVVAASGTDHTIWWANNRIRADLRPSGPKPALIWSRLRKLAPQIVWSVPEAASTVLCTPDDGCDGRPKHVE